MKKDLSTIDGWIYKIEYDGIDKMISYFFKDRPRLDILEIGSYKGKSSLMFLQSHASVYLTCIEPFVGPTDADAEHLRGQEFKSQFLDNTKEYRERITLIEKYSNDPTVRDDLLGSKFDICFIDGDHTYGSVINDIELCQIFLKEEGLLMLDDYWIDCDDTFKFRGVRDAVNEKLLYKYKFLFLIRSIITFQHTTDYKTYVL